jgi:CBS domain-containing protein
MTIVRQLLDRKGRAIFSVEPDTAVLEAIRAMAAHHVGALLVMQGSKLAGIISERDYARKVALQGRTSKDTPVRDIMTSPVVSVSPNQTVDECMRIVTAKRIRHLPVVQQGKVVGVVSIGDLVQRVISTQGEIIQYLHEYIVGRNSA